MGDERLWNERRRKPHRLPRSAKEGDYVQGPEQLSDAVMAKHHPGEPVCVAQEAEYIKHPSILPLFSFLLLSILQE